MCANNDGALEQDRGNNLLRRVEPTTPVQMACHAQQRGCLQVQWDAQQSRTDVDEDHRRHT